MYKGVDLSQWQGINFNFNGLTGFDFVILRAGYTGYGDGIKKVKDTCFETFYKNAKAKGLSVGAYWYSCANTYEKGKAEAQYMYDNCLKGKQFEYPIYIDVEEWRYHKASKKGTTEAIKGFCDTLEKLGCFAGVYANNDYFLNYIDEKEIKKYTHWLAYWTSNKPSVKYDYALWQFTNNLGVNGVGVDGNYSYVDFKTIIKNGGYNGFNKKDTPKSTPITYTFKSDTLKAGDKLQVESVNKNIITVKKL